MENINNELKSFIRDVTLFLQKHSHYNAEEIEPMFQRAYRLYVKYDVEKMAQEDQPHPLELSPADEKTMRRDFERGIYKQCDKEDRAEMKEVVS